jgi:hypothetical protein
MGAPLDTDARGDMASTWYSRTPRTRRRAGADTRSPAAGKVGGLAQSRRRPDTCIADADATRFRNVAFAVIPPQLRTLAVRLLFCVMCDMLFRLAEGSRLADAKAGRSTMRSGAAALRRIARLVAESADWRRRPLHPHSVLLVGS